MELSFGRHIPGLAADGTELHAAVFDENAVRAAAGLTMVIGAIAFCFAYFEKNYAPLQIVTTFFFVEFLLRVTIGIDRSPVGLLARGLTSRMPADWVSAKPKRFAWTLALAMAGSMMVITNSGIRGMLPRTICLICLTLMWSESVLGLCMGCQIHGFLVRRGWASKDPNYEICAHGACAIPPRETA
jgi:hypothetical protein